MPTDLLTIPLLKPDPRLDGCSVGNIPPTNPSVVGAAEDDHGESQRRELIVAIQKLKAQFDAYLTTESGKVYKRNVVELGLVDWISPAVGMDEPLSSLSGLLHCSGWNAGHSLSYLSLCVGHRFRPDFDKMGYAGRALGEFVVEELHGIAGAESLARLEKIASTDQDPFIRKIAAEAVDELKRIGTTASEATITKEACVRLVTQIADAMTQPQRLAALSRFAETDPDPAVRDLAKEALVEMGPGG